MKHPEILDFFPPDTGLETIMKVWKDNPELYKFIQALDAYIDHLEENQGKIEVLNLTPDIGMRVDIIPSNLFQKGVAKLFVHPDNYPKTTVFKTDLGDVTIHESKHIKSDEGSVVNWDEVKKMNLPGIGTIERKDFTKEPDQ